MAQQRERQGRTAGGGGVRGRDGRRPERDARRGPGPGEPYWIFGLHAVGAALDNSRRTKRRLLLTPNALQKLGEERAAAAAALEPEIQDPRRFRAPLDPQSVHQGAALLVDPLDWGPLDRVCALRDAQDAPRVLLLDRVSDPHNVGAILRSAQVFGARAVVAPARHSAPETGALAKAASGALETMPYVRVGNLAQAMATLTEIGYALIGLAGDAAIDLEVALETARAAPLGLALGAEGAGLRQLTAERCDALARIDAAGGFGSLNVSNAAAVSLYAARPKLALA